MGCQRRRLNFERAKTKCGFSKRGFLRLTVTKLCAKRCESNGQTERNDGISTARRKTHGREPQLKWWKPTPKAVAGPRQCDQPSPRKNPACTEYSRARAHTPLATAVNNNNNNNFNYCYSPHPFRHRSIDVSLLSLIRGFHLCAATYIVHRIPTPPAPP